MLLKSPLQDIQMFFLNWEIRTGAFQFKYREISVRTQNLMMLSVRKVDSLVLNIAHKQSSNYLMILQK